MSKILIVDDEISMRKLLLKIILTQGIHDVFEASNGEMSIGIYKKQRPDLVIMDMNMGKMTGLEAAHKMLKLNSNAKIIIVSSIVDRDIIQECYSIGILDYINKPINIAQIKSFVSKALNNRDNLACA